MAASPRTTFYCVYSLSPMPAPAPSPSPSSSASASPSAVRSALPRSGKLRPILTDLPGAIKKLLHQQVLLKLQQSAISASGSVFLLKHDPPGQQTPPSPGGASDGSGSLCFACLLSERADAREHTTDVSAFSFLVCLLVTKQDQFDAGFELFMPDLLAFVRGELLPLLSSMASAPNTPTEKPDDLLSFDSESGLRAVDHKGRALQLLDAWFFKMVEYFSRCVQMLNEDLHYVLHASMLGKGVRITHGEDEASTSMAQDMRRFFDALSILKLVSGQETSSAGDASSPIQLELLANGGAKVTSIDGATNEYCKEWATVLCKSSASPFITRQKVEQKKFKVIKQLNDLKRLVDAATLDNHELYRTVSQLRGDPNRDVLLAMLEADDEKASTDTRQVHQILRECS